MRALSSILDYKALEFKLVEPLAFAETFTAEQ